MKKFNEVLFTLFSILFSTAPTYSWEGPWSRQKVTAENQSRSWKQFGKQYGKKILLGIKSHPKTALIGVGGLALAYKYQENIRALFIRSNRIDYEQYNQIKTKTTEYSELKTNQNKNKKQNERQISLANELLEKHTIYDKKIRENSQPNQIEIDTFTLLNNWFLEWKK